jgi:pimeloyl-ACP methyl ester carboxylesterase
VRILKTDEREIARRFNAARTPQDLADLLRNPALDEEHALRAFLGEAKFDRLSSLAYSLGGLRGGGPTSPERNVVVLPGIMGSELTVIERGRASYNLWLDLVRIGIEGLDRLKLEDNGLSTPDVGYSVVATGLLIKYYGEILLKLGARWNVRAFPYDWRSDLDTQAAKLLAFIRNEFAGRPVAIVAHAMGGLLSRALMRLGPKANSGDPLVRRLVMLGTPNFGSFEVPRILAGIQAMVRKLILLTHPNLSVWDSNQAPLRLLEILSTFPAVYQMLPRKGTGAEGLRNAEVFRAVNPYVTQAHLDRGVGFLDSLESTIDPERMTYVAGYGFDTIVGVDPGLPLDRPSSYWSSKAGDGTVPHELGLL